MKFSQGFISSSLCFSAVAASRVGHVFIYDPVSTKATQRSSVDPETARLIFAQRLGVSQFHSIQTSDVNVIADINVYGGKQRRVIGTQQEDKVDASILVWLEDVDEEAIKAIIPDPDEYSAEFTISNPPSQSDNELLLQDFAAQADYLPKKHDPHGYPFSTGILTENILRPVKSMDTHSVYLSILEVNKSYNPATPELQKALSNVVGMSKAAEELGWPITVVLMPPEAKSKRSSHAPPLRPWGTYDLPNRHFKGHRIQARREKTEALLSLSPAQTSSSPESNISDLEDFPKVQQASDKSPKSPVLGILPSCFESADACQKQTHNCSSHGACVRVRKGNEKIADCYSCRCEATVKVIEGEGMEERRKTTNWGGPACQKKDISTPFWLFVSTGVLMAFLISGGIGLLYSMGSEELPSVIGAGVSGPARK